MAKKTLADLSPASIAFSDITSNWWIKLWRIRSKSPNSPKFSPAKIFRCMVSIVWLKILFTSRWTVEYHVTQEKGRGEGMQQSEYTDRKNKSCKFHTYLAPQCLIYMVQNLILTVEVKQGRIDTKFQKIPYTEIWIAKLEYASASYSKFFAECVKRR